MRVNPFITQWPYHLRVAPMVMARLSINLANVPVSGAIAKFG
jgi:hypothetical protein